MISNYKQALNFPKSQTNPKIEIKLWKGIKTLQYTRKLHYKY